MSSAMNRFWKVIDKSRIDASEDVEDQIDNLKLLLEEWSPEEILTFHRCFTDAVRNAYRWDVWGAAYLVSGGQTDEDGFDHFVGWLIAQGREFYQTVLDDPERLGDRVEEDQEQACEEMWSVAALAYEARTGLRDFYDVTPPIVRLTPQGEEWSESDLAVMFPRLARRFRDRR